MQININLGTYELDIFQNSDNIIYIELIDTYNHKIEVHKEITKEQVKILVDKLHEFYDNLN